MSLQDDHIWNLAQRISHEAEIWTLGHQALKLSGNKITSIWNKHRPDTNLAAHELLQQWSLQYETQTEAYTSLCSALEEAELGHLAAHLREWVEGSQTTSGLKEERVYLAYS